MTIHPLKAGDAEAARQLLGELTVTVWGIHSRRLHGCLCRDALAGRIAIVVAKSGTDLAGIALAAPAAYVYRLWWAPLLAIEVICARVKRQACPGISDASEVPGVPGITLRSDTPTYTWQQPGPAWKVLFIGVSSSYRGRGIAKQLYSSLVPNRPLVARVALENTPSLIMHRSSGWLMYPDDGCVLAVRPDAGPSAATPT